MGELNNAVSIFDQDVGGEVFDVAFIRVGVQFPIEGQSHGLGQCSESARPSGGQNELVAFNSYLALFFVSSIEAENHVIFGCQLVRMFPSIDCGNEVFNIIRRTIRCFSVK